MNKKYFLRYGSTKKLLGQISILYIKCASGTQ